MTNHRPDAAAPSTYALLANAAAANPEGTALTFLPDVAAAPVRLTHRQFVEHLHRTANLFQRLGVGPDSVVSILSPSLPEAMIAFFAAEAVGIANPINFLLGRDELAAMLNAVGTEVLVALGPHPVLDIWTKVAGLEARVPSLKATLTVGPPDPTGAAPGLAALAAAEPGERLGAGRQIAPDDIAACFHTGGSTGRPKIARHSHRNQVFVAAALAKAWDFGPGTRIVNGLPMFHVAGSLLTGLAPLAAGAEVVVPTAAGLRNPEVVAQHWRLVERLRPTVVGGIPTSLVALLEVPVADADISSVRFCATGGAPLPPSVATEFERRFGLPVHEIYGMTECAGLIATQPAGAKPRYGAAGYRLPGVDVEARAFLGDEGVGRPLPPGETGVLVVRGPNVFPGYLDPAATAAAMTADGWLITGDLGSVDADGLVTVTGRAKDVIIRGGHNIDPAVIEEAALAHPAVAMAAAVGQPDAYAGEVPFLFVTLKAGATVTGAELELHMRQGVPEGPARPREIVVLDAMPLTAVGKIHKPTLRHEACRRTVTEALAGLADEGVVKVEVADAAGGGLRAGIVFERCRDERRERVVAEARQRLERLGIVHDIAFR